MRKLGFLILMVFIAFSTACTQGNEGNKEDGSITLPDYSDWEKYRDHSKEAYLYEGSSVYIFVEHYRNKTALMTVVIFYRLETGKEWIAFHSVRNENGRRDYLFERNGEKWDFFKEVYDLNDLDGIFKERYNLVPIRPF